MTLAKACPFRHSHKARAWLSNKGGRRGGRAFGAVPSIRDGTGAVPYGIMIHSGRGRPLCLPFACKNRQHV